ncbi:MAG: hypothetical protein O7C39_03800, partial [Bacteroidetes bacterium]|nr:hypothetical protein [Bacteroidota bacterium]
PCNVLLSSKRFSPDVDVKAEESMIWVEEAQRILDKAPDFAKGIARTIVHRWAMERGHSVITTSVLEGALSTILPKSSMKAMGIISEDLATKKIGEENTSVYVCQKCGWVGRGFEPTKCTVCNAPPDQIQKLDRDAIEKLAPLEGAIHEEKAFDNVKIKWTDDARMLVKTLSDGYKRRRAKAQIEKRARVRKIFLITKDMVEDVVGKTEAATENLEDRGKLGQRAVDGPQPDVKSDGKNIVQNIRDGNYSWTPAAVERLNRVPEGFMRTATKKRIETGAASRKSDLIDLEIVEEGIKEGMKVMEEMIKKQNGKKNGKQNGKQE